MTVSGNDTPEAFKREVADSQTLGVLRPLLGGRGGGRRSHRAHFRLPAFKLVKYYFIKRGYFSTLKIGKYNLRRNIIPFN